MQNFASLLTKISKKVLTRNVGLTVFVVLMLCATVMHLKTDNTQQKSKSLLPSLSQNSEMDSGFSSPTSDDDESSAIGSITPTPDSVRVGGVGSESIVMSPAITPTVTFSVPTSTPTPPPAGGSTSTPTPTPVAMTEVGHLPTLGSNTAKVTIIEIADFQCPYCKTFFDSVFQSMKKDYIDTGKVRFAYIHLPLPSHVNAKPAAEAAECANEQGRFWQYHDVLFSAQNDWSNKTGDQLTELFLNYAGQNSLDLNIFNACITSHKYESLVDQDANLAKSKGGNATPTFFINGQSLVGAQPYESFKALIDAELQK